MDDSEPAPTDNNEPTPTDDDSSSMDDHAPRMDDNEPPWTATVMVVKCNRQLGKASSSIYHHSFCYNVLLALIRDMVGSSSLAPKGLYKVP